MPTELTYDAPAELLEDLDAMEVPQDRRPAREPWRPTRLGDVDWILAMMGAHDAEANQNRAMADEATQRALAWLDERNAKLKRRRDYLESLARAWTEEHRETHVLVSGRGKSRKLLNGELSWRKTGGRLVRDDGPEAEAALLAWAKAQGREELVRKKEEPAWAEVVKYCTGAAGGAPQVVPPGTYWEEADEYGKLDVKPADKALARVGGGQG